MSGMGSMSDLLNAIEDPLLAGLISLAVILTLTSVLTAVWLSFRRIKRNRDASFTAARQKQFEEFLQDLLGAREFPKHYALPEGLIEDHTAITGGLLKFFKIVKGEDANRLKLIIDHLHLEPVVQKATTTGNRGKRMRAFNALSFMDSQSSLKAIAENLYSNDKYIRLSVARCLARRQVLSLVSEVAQSIATAFPKDEKLIADVLRRFGPNVVPLLEELIAAKHRNTIIAGALETLILLRPARTSVDFDSLIHHPDERVRAAAIQFSVMTEHGSKQDLLLMGLEDSDRGVKIRSIKIAMKEQRNDTFSRLYVLMQDPFLWVRYWAMRAALLSGKSGETLMRSVARRDGPMGDLAHDVIHEGRA